MLISISQRVNKVKVLVIQIGTDPAWLAWEGTVGSNAFVEVGNILCPEQKGRFWEQLRFQPVKIQIFNFLVDRIENFLSLGVSRFFFSE